MKNKKIKLLTSLLTIAPISTFAVTVNNSTNSLKNNVLNTDNSSSLLEKNNVSNLKEYEIDPEKISCIEFNYNIVSNVAFTNIYYKDGNFKNIEENVIKLSKFLMDNKIL